MANMWTEPSKIKSKSSRLWWLVFAFIVLIVSTLLLRPVVNFHWGMVLVQVPQSEGVNWYVVHGGGITHVADNVLSDRNYYWYDHANGITFVTHVNGVPSMTSVHLDEIEYGPLGIYEYPQEDGSEVLKILSEQYDNSLPYRVRKVDGSEEIRWFS